MGWRKEWRRAADKRLEQPYSCRACGARLFWFDIDRAGQTFEMCHNPACEFYRQWLAIRQARPKGRANATS